jgi:hypothetical protein
LHQIEQLKKSIGVDKDPNYDSNSLGIHYYDPMDDLAKSVKEPATKVNSQSGKKLKKAH